jgi:hypothetical protein
VLCGTKPRLADIALVADLGVVTELRRMWVGSSEQEMQRDW